MVDKRERFVSRMTAVRTGLWLTTLSAPTPPLWPPNTTSANSELTHLRCLTCGWRRCSAETNPAEGTSDLFVLCLLQALYPHHGLPARSGQVDRGEDAERVSVCLQRQMHVRRFIFIESLTFFPTILTHPHKTKQHLCRRSKVYCGV